MYIYKEKTYIYINNIYIYIFIYTQSILVFDTKQDMYSPVLGQIQFSSFDRRCKTCLDTKPVLYQGRFCSLTHVRSFSILATRIANVIILMILVILIMRYIFQVLHNGWKPPTLRFMPNALTIWAIRARHFLSHVKLAYKMLPVRWQQHSFSSHLIHRKLGACSHDVFLLHKYR